MENRTVLVIAYYFPPMGLSGVQRTLKFVKYLTHCGWNPIVLTLEPSKYYAYDDDLSKELDELGVKVYRTPNPKKKSSTSKFPSYFKQRIGRAVLQTIHQPDSQIKWKPQAISLGKKIIEENKIDVIFATAPPFTDFLIAKELSETFDIPYIIDYRDIWIDNPFHFFATPFHKMYSINLERSILTKVNKIIVTTRFTKELLLKRYRIINHDDITIIPQGYDSDDFLPWRSTKPLRSKFTITHSGLFQDNRSPKYFLKAMSSFIKKNSTFKDKIEIRFVGIMRQSHIKLIKKYGLQDITVCTGYVPHVESIRHLMESDVLWMMLNDSVRSPGKLYEYFGARKPLIVSSPDGVIRKTALECKATIATEPKDCKEIENAISSFFKLWQSNALPVPDEDFVQSFDRKKLTEELSRELTLATAL